MALDRDEAIEEMREWFLSRFEDPAEACPYESAEGGYIYIWGGPFEPLDELSSEFSGVYPDDWIEDLASDLDVISTEWSGSSRDTAYEDELVDQILSITDACQVFSSAVLDIESLLKQDVAESVKEKYLQLLHANVITALETYLSDTFIGRINKNESLRRRFVETCPDFAKRKLEYSSIYAEMERLDSTVNAYLLDVVWHNVGRIKPLFKGALGIEIPDVSDSIHKAIQVRHDIVHRNGMSKDGTIVHITHATIRSLIEDVEAFVVALDAMIRGLES